MTTNQGTGISVPQQYVSLLQQMSQSTGIPYAVEAAQAQAESGFNPRAVSSTGAEGWLQFEPATYDTYAAGAGVKPGSEFDPASEAKVYTAFMTDLLKQEKGSLRDALAAYNAGPGNLSAGYGYADSILAKAGSGNLTVDTSKLASNATTTGILSGGGLSVSGVVQDAINAVLNAMGLASLKDMLERAGLVILGFALVLMGIHILSSGKSTSVVKDKAKGLGGSEEEVAKSSSSSYQGRHRKIATKEVATGAREAVEAAAVA